MGKRFTETSKWADRWFARLSKEHKLFWVYLCDNCDQAGVWDEPELQAQAKLGILDFDFEKAKEAFGDRVEILPNGAWWLVKFIAFQNPKGLVKDANYHKPVFASLEKNGISISRVGQELTNPTSRDLDKDKDKDKGQDLEDPKKTFEVFWEAYPRKVGKAAAQKIWTKQALDLNTILEALRWQVKSTDHLNREEKFIPHATTWLNQKRWLDEAPAAFKRKERFEAKAIQPPTCEHTDVATTEMFVRGEHGLELHLTDTCKCGQSWPTTIYTKESLESSIKMMPDLQMPKMLLKKLQDQEGKL